MAAVDIRVRFRQHLSITIVVTVPARSFILLHDRGDLSDASSCCPEALGECVLAFDPDLHSELDHLKIRHVTPWEFVRTADLSDLRSFEAALLDHWNTHGGVEFRGINLLAMAAYRHHSAFARLVWSAFVLQRALQQVRPSTVYVFDDTGGHGLDRPLGCRQMPLLQGTLRGIAEQCGITVRIVRRLARTSPVTDVTHRMSGNVGSDGTGVALDEITHGSPYILFHANRTDLIRQLPLIREVAANTRYVPVQLYNDAAPDVLDRCSAGGHAIVHEQEIVSSDDSAGDGPAGVRTLAESYRIQFDLASEQTSPELRSLLVNPYIRSHFDFLYGDYASAMAKHVIRWGHIFCRHRPAALVVNYHAPLLDVASTHGIPCLVLPHALMMIGHSDWYQTLPTNAVIAALSDYHRSRLIRSGIAPDRIEVVGDPWTDVVSNASRDGATCALRTNAITLGPETSPSARHILILTGSFGMPSTLPHLPFIDWADAVRSVHELSQLILRRQDWTFTIRCHPRFDHRALYDRVVHGNNYGDNVSLQQEGTLRDAVSKARAVCVWNTVTSAMVEASYFDRPVLLFSRSLMGYDPTTWGTQRWPHAGSISTFESYIDMIFRDPVKYSRALRQTRDAVNLCMGDSRMNSTSRCLSVLSKLTCKTPETSAQRFGSSEAIATSPEDELTSLGT